MVSTMRPDLAEIVESDVLNAGISEEDRRALAGLLFAVPAYLPGAEEKLKESFGAAVASLVAGISRLNALRVITRSAAQGKDPQSQAEVLRKMLLAMVEDIRVVLLRLASRTQTMRWLVNSPEAA